MSFSGDAIIGALGKVAAEATLRRTKEDFVYHGVALWRGLAAESCMRRCETQVAFREVLHQTHERPLAAAREYLELHEPQSLAELRADVRAQLRA
jgi:hypothetical protein